MLQSDWLTDKNSKRRFETHFKGWVKIALFKWEYDGLSVMSYPYLDNIIFLTF